MRELNRRSFLKNGLIAGSLLATPTLLGGCFSVTPRPNMVKIDSLISSGARVMWVAAHPDDEALVGAILAKSSLAYKNPLYFLILTHGDGGECCLENGCLPDLATIRGREMEHVASLYHAELQHESFFNAPLPVESFPARHELAKIWNDKADPAIICAKAIRRFKPDIIFTFAPNNGFTGHPEHQLASRFATTGARLAADTSLDLNGLSTHRTKYVYYALNKYWPFMLLGKGDPGEVTETWDATQKCVNGWECRDIMARFSNAHETQYNDMSMVRKMIGLIKKVYLRQVNPYTEILDPFEVLV